MMYEMTMSRLRGYENTPAEWALAVLVFGSPSALGVYVLRSRKIGEFFA